MRRCSSTKKIERASVVNDLLVASVWTPTWWRWTFSSLGHIFFIIGLWSTRGVIPNDHDILFFCVDPDCSKITYTVPGIGPHPMILQWARSQNPNDVETKMSQAIMRKCVECDMKLIKDLDESTTTDWLSGTSAWRQYLLSGRPLWSPYGVHVVHNIDQIRAHDRNNDTTALAAMDDQNLFGQVLAEWWRCFVLRQAKLSVN
jgi:hypothetical protein